MFRILFLCTGNSGRSQMAEAFARRMAPEDTILRSAADNDTPINPTVIALMQELDLAIPQRNEPSLSHLASEPFDVVITLCEKAHEQCPTFPGSPTRIHWSLTDPVKLTRDDEDPTPYFKRLRDEIRDRVRQFFEHGYFDAIKQMRGTFGALLNNMTDGVMAHDGNDQVFFFNHAAERITGLSYGDVIGRPCHDILPAGFCKADHLCPDEYKHVHISFSREKDNEEVTVDLTCTEINIPGRREPGALVIFRDLTETMRLRQELRRGLGFEGLIGQHHLMQKIFGVIRELAEVQTPVLIQGENGVGKKMVAHALHSLGPRSTEPFVIVTTSAIPTEQLEAELFGHAGEDKPGAFRKAHNGVLLLDEITELPDDIQAKLLRVLQEKTIVPVGDGQPVEVNVRLICATSKDLKTEVNEKRFREDLYYRLAVVPLRIPALRERKEDIPLLVDHFRNLHAMETHKPAKSFTRRTMERLEQYDWPGNVRELANAVQYASLNCRGEIIEVEHLPEDIRNSQEMKRLARRGPGRPPKSTPQEALDMMEKMDEDRTRAAEALGVSRVTLYRLLKKANY